MSRRLCVLALATALPAAADAPPAKPEAAAPSTRQLQVYQRVMPRYTADIGPDGGCVTVKFQILHTGLVGDVTVLVAKPATLAEPTVAAIKQWVFQSFPPGGNDVYAVQTFNYAPEVLRMPDDAIRSSFATMDDAGAVVSAGCGAAKPAVTAQPEAKKPDAPKEKAR